jgi:hypothetical protein
MSLTLGALRRRRNRSLTVAARTPVENAPFVQAKSHSRGQLKRPMPQLAPCSDADCVAEEAP